MRATPAAEISGAYVHNAHIAAIEPGVCFESGARLPDAQTTDEKRNFHSISE